MVETYGHRWTANFGEAPRPDHAWAKHLTGLNGKHIANGLAQLSNLNNDGWPPSAPQFRNMCLQVPGLPGESEAWEQALSGVYSHDAVRIAANATGVFDLRAARLNDKALHERFKRNYAIVRARALMGKPLAGDIAEGISHQAKTPKQVQDAYTHRQARNLVMSQNIPLNAQQARQMLLAGLGINRRDQHV